MQTQREDGTWDEPQYTGTGFPCDYYINYHLYRLTFPVMALGRCLRDAIPGSLGRAGDLATVAAGSEGAAAAAAAGAANGASPYGTVADGASTRER